LASAALLITTGSSSRNRKNETIYIVIHIYNLPRLDNTSFTDDGDISIYTHKAILFNASNNRVAETQYADFKLCEKTRGDNFLSIFFLDTERYEETWELDERFKKKITLALSECIY
jgi:hypothetical protein